MGKWTFVLFKNKQTCYGHKNNDKSQNKEPWYKNMHKTGRLSNTGLFKLLPPPKKTIQIKENKQNKRRVKEWRSKEAQYLSKCSCYIERHLQCRKINQIRVLQYKNHPPKTETRAVKTWMCKVITMYSQELLPFDLKEALWTVGGLWPNVNSFFFWAENLYVKENYCNILKDLLHLLLHSTKVHHH